MPGLEHQNWGPPAYRGLQQPLGNEGETGTSKRKVWAPATGASHPERRAEEQHRVQGGGADTHGRTPLRTLSGHTGGFPLGTSWAGRYTMTHPQATAAGSSQAQHTTPADMEGKAHIPPLNTKRQIQSDHSGMTPDLSLIGRWKILKGRVWRGNKLCL